MSLKQLSRLLWAIALIALPVTSFRYFPFLGSTTYVRPLALYPLGLLVIVLLIQLKRGKIISPVPGSLILLSLVIFAILVSTAIGWLIDPIPLRGQTFLGRAMRALITLSVGLVFFVSAVWMNKDKDDFIFSVKWIMVGLVISLLWSGIQALTFYTPILEKEMVTHWQLGFSMRELVRTNRISGLAYEPSWLAGQIATIYFPLLFSSVITRTNLTNRKWIEPVLLGATFLMLLMTYSRGGLLISISVSGLVFLIVGRAHIKNTWRWFTLGFSGKLFDWVIRLVIAGAIFGVFASSIVFLSQKTFFTRLWEFNADSLSDYMININAGARGAYATGALGAYENYPVFGVGFGASGFYIYDNLPDWSLTTVPEIARQLNPENHLFPNPKNMYVRLLAETGLVGFILFLVFQFSVLGDILKNFKKDGHFRFIAVAGLFAWLAICLYNFTQDSFATANIWLVPGIVVGITRGEV